MGDSGWMLCFSKAVEPFLLGWEWVGNGWSRVGVAGKGGEQQTPACTYPWQRLRGRTAGPCLRWPLPHQPLDLIGGHVDIAGGEGSHIPVGWNEEKVAENFSSYNEILMDSSISILRPIFTVKRLLIGTLNFHENSRNRFLKTAWKAKYFYKKVLIKMESCPYHKYPRMQIDVELWWETC